MRRKEEKEYMVLIAGKVPPETDDNVRKIIAQRKWSRSQFVREAIEEKVQRDLASAA